MPRLQRDVNHGGVGRLKVHGRPASNGDQTTQRIAALRTLIMRERCATSDLLIRSHFYNVLLLEALEVERKIA